jgi:hypothetical protein
LYYNVHEEQYKTDSSKTLKKAPYAMICIPYKYLVFYCSLLCSFKNNGIITDYSKTIISDNGTITSDSETIISDNGAIISDSVIIISDNGAITSDSETIISDSSTILVYTIFEVYMTNHKRSNL